MHTQTQKLPHMYRHIYPDICMFSLSLSCMCMMHFCKGGPIITPVHISKREGRRTSKFWASSPEVSQIKAQLWPESHSPA